MFLKKITMWLFMNYYNRDIVKHLGARTRMSTRTPIRKSPIQMIQFSLKSRRKPEKL